MVALDSNMNILEPNEVDHLLSRQAFCQGFSLLMLKYFLLLSIPLHALALSLAFVPSGNTPHSLSPWTVYRISLSELSGTERPGSGKGQSGKTALPVASPQKTKNANVPKAQQQKDTAITCEAKAPESPEEENRDSGDAPVQDGRNLSEKGGQGTTTLEGGASEEGIAEHGGGEARKVGAGNGGDGNLPVALHQVSPAYPRKARRENISGRVVISCTVTTQGNVAEPVVTVSEPEGIFDQSALTALKQWKFSPAFHNGHPVPSRITVPFRFELD